MTAPVNRHRPFPRGGVAEVALDIRLEALDVRALEDGLGGVLDGRVRRGHHGVEVALQASRVRREGILRRVRAEVDGEVLERASRDAAASRAAARKPTAGKTAAWEPASRVVHLGAVGAHRRRGAVEERRLLDAAGVETPFPVRKCARVTAQVSQLLLVCPDVGPVEEEEVGLKSCQLCGRSGCFSGA